MQRVKWGIRIVAVLVAGGALAGCGADETATGGGGTATTTTRTDTSSGGGGSGGAATTSSGGGGAGGGTGGTTSTGGGGAGGGGAGGGTGGTTSTGGGGAGGGTGGSGGGPLTGTALLLRAAQEGELGADYHPGVGWSTVSFGGPGSHSPGVGLLDADNGVGVFNQLQFNTLLFVEWTSGQFSAPSPVDPLVTTVDSPSLVAWPGGAAVVYKGADFEHNYYAEYNGPGAGWSPVAEPILADGVHSSGIRPPAIAVVKGEIVIAYVGPDGDLYDQKRVGGVWQSATAHGVPLTGYLTPTLTEIAIGPTEALLAYVRDTDAQVMFLRRNGGVWTAPAPVPGAFASDRVALVNISGNSAVLVYRANGGPLYTTTYVPGQDPLWSPPTPLGATTDHIPAMAKGIGGADAELVFDAAGQLMHTRLNAGVWSEPSPVGAPGGPGAQGFSLATFSP